MPNILYTIIIFPIEQILEIIFVFAHKITLNPGLSVIGLSIAVSTILLPLYLMAEKHQQNERNKQKLMKPEIDNINAVFKGDKRHMLLSVLYRQNNYHPVHSLRNSIDLFIQIPFFIAAYHYLSNLDFLAGKSFFIIKDLNSPDMILNGINLLPILMTLINCISGAIYTKGFPLKDKIQVYGIATIFLILLYNSPVVLVLYWTCNNIYNLLKNILIKIKHSKKIILGLAYIFFVILMIYIIFFHPAPFTKRLVACMVITFFLLIPIWYKKLLLLKRKINFKDTILEKPEKSFILSLVIIFLLMGIVIPSGLISTSVIEFSFMDPFSSPFPLIFISILQSLGILFWLICIYFLFNKRTIQISMVVLFTILSCWFLINTFIFTGNYGSMNPDMSFFLFSDDSFNDKILNILILLGSVILTFFLLLQKRKMIYLSFQLIIIVSLFFNGLYNFIQINHSYSKIPKQSYTETESNLPDIYTFSKTGNNILLIVLDSSKSGYLPYIFEEKPELFDSFSGFTYYPNTISFGPHTNFGMPGIFGGYYYTPDEIQKRSNELWHNKYYESMQILPRILSESGFNVKISNQPDMDISLYENSGIEVVNYISRQNIISPYTIYYMNKNNDFSFINYSQHLYKFLIRYSYFRVSPLIIRKFIYDKGKYFTMNELAYSYRGIENYAFLHNLPDFTVIDDNPENYANLFISELPHGTAAAYFETPEYTPSNKITNIGSGPFSKDKFYHTSMASYLLVGRWFDYLKDNGVYDNTRIIIVSDHGDPELTGAKNNILLPNGFTLNPFNALLLVKDFNSSHDLITDYTFMTNADPIHIATNNIIDNPRNPFTNEIISINKDNGVYITTSTANKFDNMSKNSRQYNIKNNEWLFVRDNIFDLDNWRFATFEEIKDKL